MLMVLAKVKKTDHDELPFTASDIVTNPPFKLANQFVLKALEQVRKFAFLLGISGRYLAQKKYFNRNPPSSVYVFLKG